MTYSETPLKRSETSLFIAWPLHYRFLVYICVSVPISVSEKQKHREDFSRPFQRSDRATQCRSYSMHCDRPSHLPRVVKGRGCHSAPAQSLMPRSTCPACYWLWNQLLTWSTMFDCFRNQIPTANWKTSNRPLSWRRNRVRVKFSFTQMLLKARTL